MRNPRKSLLTDGFDLKFGVNYFNWWRQPALWLNSGGSNNVPHTTLNNWFEFIYPPQNSGSVAIVIPVIRGRIRDMNELVGSRHARISSWPTS